jgi:S-DNA-T family DNA segregation ATPase FtsK/SpoIIIE
LEPKVFDAEFLDGTDHARSGYRPAARRAVRPAVMLCRSLVIAVFRWWCSPAIRRVRSVVAYRVRKAPMDGLRLLWFVLRGHGRWIGKAWGWATYADLRSDARAARVAVDREARRQAQELIRADARARWGRLAVALRRIGIGAVAVIVLAVVLKLTDALMGRADMWPWLAATYDALDGIAACIRVVGPWLLLTAACGWLVAAAFEGRDRSPGAGWLVSPDRGDADSWVDERMISKALAHLGISPLDRFFKDGGELLYAVSARKDGDGTFAQVRLPLGVTADMVAARRSKLAANLGRASLETWPTKGDEDGVLDLWVADKGVLRGGAGAWPRVHEGQVDVFDGVPFGLSQRGLVINAPLIGVNWLIGGRPGQGKSAALRTLLLGAALDPTAELWVFVMGESPDFDPFTPRLARYWMGMDDKVAEAATQALADLLAEMEQRGKMLGAQAGRPPKVSRKLADRRALGLHPLVCGIDECHELFQHPRYGKQAAELAVRLIKRGRKYGIVLLLATQSQTKDIIPREVTRNVSCGVAFSVADQVANDGLLGSGKYSAGIRATELRINTDRGSCVAVGITDETFELVRTFYVHFEDGADDVSPVIARSLALITDTGRPVEPNSRARLEPAAPVADPLTDVAAVLDGQRRVRTQVILTRLAQLNSDYYEGWTVRDLRAALAAHNINPAKSGGNKVIRAEDVDAALTARRTSHRDADDGDKGRDRSGTQGPIPIPSPPEHPHPDQQQHQSGTPGTHDTADPGHRLGDGVHAKHRGSLADDPGGPG